MATIRRQIYNPPLRAVTAKSGNEMVGRHRVSRGAAAPSPEMTTEPMVPDQPTCDLTLDASADPPPPPAPVPLAGDLVGAYRIAPLPGPAGWASSTGRETSSWTAGWRSSSSRRSTRGTPVSGDVPARVAGGRRHRTPNVIPVYRADEDGERLYIAMRLVEGESLADLIARRGRIPPAQAARVLGQISSALEAAHARACSTVTSSRPTSW